MYPNSLQNYYSLNISHADRSGSNFEQTTGRFIHVKDLG